MSATEKTTDKANDAVGTVSGSAVRMKEFKTKLVELMDIYGVKVYVGYGEYSYNGISFIWFVDATVDRHDRPDTCIDIEGDLPTTE